MTTIKNNLGLWLKSITVPTKIIKTSIINVTVTEEKASLIISVSLNLERISPSFRVSKNFLGKFKICL